MNRYRLRLVLLPVTCLVLVLSLTAACAASKCAMCGMDCPKRVATSVQLSDGNLKDYCCPHCAAMGMAMLDPAKLTVESVTLRDFTSGRGLPTDSAVCLMRSSTVPCCAPSVLAFASKAAAQAYQRRHGGVIYGWRDVAARLTGRKCAACPMSVYTPSAFSVLVGGKRSYACCPICAIMAVLKAGGTGAISGWVGSPARRAEIQISSGEPKSPSPPGLTVWLVSPPAGKMPTCHSWRVFPDAKSLDTWREAHPGPGQVVDLKGVIARAEMKLSQSAK